jgi:hypothetical protein
MKRWSENWFFFKKRAGALLLLAALLLGSASFAQKKNKKPKPEIDFDFSLTTMYDDNILKYSDKYLERFLNNEDQGRFHINTYDDVILKPSLGASATFKIFGKQNSVFDASAGYSKYLNNDVKSWGSFGIGYRQYFSRKLSVKIFYDYIPEFYVRHFRDDDWTAVYGFTEEAFTPYIFSKDNYGIWGQYTILKNTRFRLYYYYSKYYHNKHYTEYDSDNNLYRIKVFQPLHSKLTLEATYQFVTSDAKGYDEPGENKETSDDGDATYEEDGFIFGLTWKMPRIKKRYHTLEFETVIYNRYYQTDKTVLVDRLHSGRVDNNLRFYLTYYLSLSRTFKFYAYYKWYQRESGTTSVLNDEFVSDEKDYVQNQVGIRILYKLGL